MSIKNKDGTQPSGKRGKLNGCCKFVFTSTRKKKTKFVLMFILGKPFNHITRARLSIHKNIQNSLDKRNWYSSTVLCCCEMSRTSTESDIQIEINLIEILFFFIFRLMKTCLTWQNVEWLKNGKQSLTLFSFIGWNDSFLLLFGNFMIEKYFLRAIQ